MNSHAVPQGLAPRPILYAIFGVAVGAAYGYLASLVTGGRPVPAGVLTVIGFGLMGFFGYLVGGDPEDTHWRRVILLLLLPVIPLVGAIVLVALPLVSVLVSPVYVVQGMVARRRFRAAMESKGRYILWHELRPKLENGQGTLLAESGQKGCFRIWYTEDKILDKGTPVSSDDEYSAVVWGQCSHVFNSRCIQEYIDEDEGTGLLTPIRPSMLRRISARYPDTPVVTLVRSVVSEDAKD